MSLAGNQRRWLQRGFTLIEIMLVVAVMGMLAGAAALRLGALMEAVTAKDVAKIIAFADAGVREASRRSGKPVQLVINLNDASLQRHDDAGDGRIVHLPSGWQVTKLLVQDKSYTAGPVTVNCSPAGYTPTYGLLLTSSKGQTIWILIAGLSGQESQGLNDSEVQKIFGHLAGIMSPINSVPEQFTSNDPH